MATRVTLTQTEQGWIAHAQDIRAIAQGTTRQEALDGIHALLDAYPEMSVGDDEHNFAVQENNALADGA